MAKKKITPKKDVNQLAKYIVDIATKQDKGKEIRITQKKKGA